MNVTTSVHETCEANGLDDNGDLILPSGSNMRGMSRYFSATSKAKFKFSKGLSCGRVKKKMRAS